MNDEERKEYKELEKENESIRLELDNLIALNHPLYSPIWIKINALIDVEIKMENFCNE